MNREGISVLEYFGASTCCAVYWPYCFLVIGIYWTIYGVIAGYKGRRTDEALMRVNDLIVFLPALPILILLTATLGRSIFIITVLLVIFGWAGVPEFQEVWRFR